MSVDHSENTDCFLIVTLHYLTLPHPTGRNLKISQVVSPGCKCTGLPLLVAESREIAKMFCHVPHDNETDV